MPNLEWQRAVGRAVARSENRCPECGRPLEPEAVDDAGAEGGYVWPEPEGEAVGLWRRLGAWFRGRFGDG